MKRSLTVLTACYLLALNAVAAFAWEKTKVAVSIPPLAFFAERIGMSRVDVSTVVEPGRSPHSYEPSPRQITRLAESHVFFTVGLPLDKALAKKLSGAAPALRIVDLSEGIERVHVSHESEHEAGRNGTENHDHGHIDPHIWLDPKNAMQICREITYTLGKIDPQNRMLFDANLVPLVNELSSLDQRLARLLAPLKGQEFFVFHPAFGYFGEAYGLKQVAIETGGKEPGPKALAKLIDRAKKRQVRVLFVQPQFSEKAARMIAESIGAAVVPIDPLARDYMANLERIADAIAKAPASDGVQQQ